MKSVRLTIERRSRLLHHIVDKAFAKPKKKLAHLWMVFSDDCYLNRYSEDERSRMLRDPNKENVYNMCWGVDDYSFNGQGFNTWRKELMDTKMSESRPFWLETPSQRRRFDKDHELTKRFVKLANMSEVLKNEINDLKKEVSAIICVNTTKQLLENWPESEAFLIGSGIMKAPAAPVPMKYPDELNKKLCSLIGKKSPTCKGGANVDKQTT